MPAARCCLAARCRRAADTRRRRDGRPAPRRRTGRHPPMSHRRRTRCEPSPWSRSPSASCRRTLNVAGKVQFDEDRLAHVLAPLAGQVVDLRVKVGDVVQKGQTLCAINSREATAAIGEHVESHKDLELAEKTTAMTRISSTIRRPRKSRCSRPRAISPRRAPTSRGTNRPCGFSVCCPRPTSIGSTAACPLSRRFVGRRHRTPCDRRPVRPERQ